MIDTGNAMSRYLKCLGTADRSHKKRVLLPLRGGKYEGGEKGASHEGHLKNRNEISFFPNFHK